MADYTVTGAGDADALGDYTITGTFRGKEASVNSNGWWLTWTEFDFVDWWALSESQGGLPRYAVENSDLTPPLGTYPVEEGGTPPAAVLAVASTGNRRRRVLIGA